jgi:hypothetical protein
MPKTSTPIPVYIPWDAFTDFVKKLKSTRVPSRIDKSILMHLPALTRGQILSALRFLKLIDENGSTKSGALSELADSFDTPQWGNAVKEHVVAAFDGIISGLDLEHATPHQLDECFDKVVGKEQMRRKSERFYLSALTAASVPFSPHLVRRAAEGTQSKPAASRKPRPKKPSASKIDTGGATGGAGDTQPKKDGITPNGMLDFPIPIPGESTSFIRVPRTITTDDLLVFKAAMAVVDALAQQNGPGKKS